MKDHSPLGARAPSCGSPADPEPSALSVSDILSRAADLIEPEGAWTQLAFARTAKGRPIGALEEPAACWCVVGAMQRIAGDRQGLVYEAEIALLEALGEAPASYNDATGRTQAEVVAALRQAAKLSEGGDA